MEGGELFRRIQEHGDQGFTERGTAHFAINFHPYSYIFVFIMSSFFFHQV